MIKKLISCMLVLSCFSAAFGQTTKTVTVNVYFHNEKFNPNQEDCTKVYPTPRTVPATKAIARAAIDELFKGTTEDERAKQFWSMPPEDTRDIVKSLRIANGTAFLNFNKIVFAKLGNTTSSCGSGFYSSIEATLKQFPSVRRVIYAVEGNTNDFYEWVQVGECPYSKKLFASSNFR